MSDPRSFVLGSVGVSADAADLESAATLLRLKLKRLADLPQLSLDAALSADLLSDGPTLIVGTGAVRFDASVAAAYGVPLVLLVDKKGANVDLVAADASEAGAVVADVVTADELSSVGDKLGVDAQPVIGPELFQHNLLNQAKAVGAHIVLPEGDDDRILEAASELLAQGVAKLTILGDPDKLTARAAELGADISGAELIDHLTSPLAEEFAADFAELRKAKGVTLEQARETMKDISYFGTMMVHKGLADGMVSGAAHTTAHTIKPSFQIIKTVPEASVVSSIFLMVFPGRLWAFGDCAVNPNPTAEQVGEIACVSAKTASQFGIDPRVALLSYSSGSSGSGPDVDKALAALAKAREIDADLAVDGPLQFDAACDEGVAKKKMPDSPVAGKANVFVFPDLEAGNIGYKIAQRTGGALAVGPILQGLKKPVNDLSRGATVPDIINTVAVTAIQAGDNK